MNIPHVDNTPERGHRISSRNLLSLPDIGTLRRLCQSLALLDAILQPEWDLRYYSFNAHWAAGEMTASMDNGSGDDYFLLFNSAGAILKGYGHESAMARHVVDTGGPYSGVLDDVPPEFAAFLAEPAFSIAEATFCLWRRQTDQAWQKGKIAFPDGDDADGSADLLSLLDNQPHTYRDWAEEYYERTLPLKLIEKVYGHQPLTGEIVRGLNPQMTLERLAADREEIGYP